MEPSRPGSVDDGQRPSPGRATTAQVAALYDQHAAAMLGLALHILGDRNEAEEVLEEVFLYVWEHVNELGENPRATRTGCSRRHATCVSPGYASSPQAPQPNPSPPQYRASARLGEGRR